MHNRVSQRSAISTQTPANAALKSSRRLMGLAITLVGAGAAVLAAPVYDTRAQDSANSQTTKQPNSQTAGEESGAVFHGRVNQVLGVLDSQIIALDVDVTPGAGVAVPIPVDGAVATLNMSPHSVRAEGYRIRAQVEDGSLVEVEPGAVRTMRGELAEFPGSVAAGSLLDDGLHVMIVMPPEIGGERLWVEPVPLHVEG